MASSSSGGLSPSTVNGTSRMTGLGSGLDVDSLVEKSVAAEKLKVNKLKQQKQKTEWIQEAYRGITSGIQAFADKYFSTSSTSSIMNRRTFQAFAIASSDAAVSADYTSEATAGMHTVTVSQLATAASKSSTGTLSKEITGRSAASINYSELANTSFKLSVDGVNYTIKLDATVTNATKLQAAIDSAVGANKVQVDTSSGYLKLAAVANSGVQKITVSNPDSKSSATSLSVLGFTDMQSNRISTQATLETLAAGMKNAFSFDSHGQVALTINGTNFTFDKDTTLDEMISEINNSSAAGVTMKYDEIADKLIMTSDKTGAGTTLTVSETGSTFLSATLGTNTTGQDAKLTVDGVAFTRSSNTVTVGGIIYTLSKETKTAAGALSPVTVNVSQDTDAIYKNISSFVDDYNALIETINSKLAEEYDDDYPPLTDDQKKDMSDDEIENWEKKAKTGLLARDSTLSSFMGGMREVLSEAISGVSLSSIGIEPQEQKYKEKGKLYITEDTLKSAIKNNPEGVLNLFTKQSEDYPGTNMRKLSTSQRATRFKQEGIAYRLYDILQDNISTLGDRQGNKGLLLEKAGVAHDSSDTDNALSDQIKDLKARIEKEEKHLDSEEDRLYKKYSLLETYINKMNNQLSQISSMTS